MYCLECSGLLRVFCAYKLPRPRARLDRVKNSLQRIGMIERRALRLSATRYYGGIVGKGSNDTISEL